LLTLSVLSGFSLDTIRVSAVDYPAIMVVPESTWNESLTPGMNYTVSIYTNYTDDDVWSYIFTLYYDPNVLHGGINKTDTWTGTGGQTKFYTTYTPVMTYNEYVYLNGTLQTRDEDYRMNYLTGEVWFKYAPGNEAEVKATYLYGVVNGDLITKDEHSEATFQTGTFNNTIGKLGD
ncbi:MAG: hypothetical protein GWN67_19290, partial [Phycisphaerae bacterium]|nr:hypothetical protein [Phycisphaerae bacterium]